MSAAIALLVVGIVIGSVGTIVVRIAIVDLIAAIKEIEADNDQEEHNEAHARM